MRRLRTDARIELLRLLGALCVFGYHFAGDASAAGAPSFGVIWQSSGPFGVCLFLVLSGVVSTWAWDRRSDRTRYWTRRLSSIFPLYWWVAIPLIALALASGRMPASELWKAPFWLTGLGIVSPETFFPVVDGWWYMTLVLQFAMLYPLLRRVQDVAGRPVFLIGAAVVSVLASWSLSSLGLGYATLGFAGSRLIEFACGMTLGRDIAAGARAWPTMSTIVAACAALLAFGVRSPSQAIQVCIASIAAVCALGLIPSQIGRWASTARVLGGYTFAFYLVHSPWTKLVMSATEALPWTLGGGALRAIAALAVACAVTWVFSRTFSIAAGRWAKSATADNAPVSDG